MNVAGWILTVAILSAAAGSGAGAAVRLYQHTQSSPSEEGPPRSLATTCARSAALTLAAR